MRTAHWLWAAILALPTCLLASETDLSQIRAALQEPIRGLEQSRTITGTFTQEKRLDGFPQELLSSGSFDFVRGQALIWHTLDPIDSRLVLKADGAGPEGATRNKAQSAAMEGLGQLFNALFSLDIEQLNKRFRIKLLQAPSTDSPNWRLALVPRDEDHLVNFASSLQVSGAAHIDVVKFSESNGDQTTIRLHNVQMGEEGGRRAASARVESP